MRNAPVRGLPHRLELVIATLALIALAPLFLLIALLIKLSSRGPVLFRQTRVGFGGKTFTILKFRTMRVANAGVNLTSANDSRVTAVGRYLRRFKLDELPQLLNVLRNEMSFVGPRPEVPEYVDLKNPLWQEILSARPGLTDPVTLRLRNEEHLLAAVEDKEEFYKYTLQPYKIRGWAWFVRHKTWKTDLRIIGRTIRVILLPHTAPPPTHEDLKLSWSE